MFALDQIDEWGPEKVVVVSHRRSGMRGVLVIDNTARGMGKGGTRMGPSLEIGEVARLARTMTWKWAALDLHLGGAKAGILGDPASPRKEELLRAFARALASEVPAEYVFGLDMGLSEADAAIFVDELGDRGVSAGLPDELGGLPYDRLGLTGFGVVESCDAALATLGLPLAGSSVAIQGFGAVGTAAAARFTELGATVVAVATATGCVVEPSGLDVPLLLELQREHGDDCVRAYGQTLPAEAVFDQPVDVLVPAAREDVIDHRRARDLPVRLVVEGANLPTSPTARAVLHERGVLVVPDFIANAGAVVAAAHTLAQPRSPFPVEVETVRTMVATRLRTNVTQVLAAASSSGVTPHQAALELAQQRVRAAMRVRGQLG